MRPDERDLDYEIRGHLAIEIQQRIERGEDPEAARLAALREFGYVPAMRESMRRVWYSRWFDGADALRRDLHVAGRSLWRAKGLAATVVVTLALGIGVNTAIVSVVREVLLRPLANRDEDRLIYIRQRAPGIGVDNLTFSVPEIHDLKARVRTIAAFGDFSTVDFTLVGLGEPREVQAGVVNGAFFEVMGLRPLLGRLLTPQDDGPQADGAAVLTYRFWTTALNSDPSVVGRVIRLGTRAATVVGVLEPSVPYPADTEIIANVVTSPHHLGAMMVTQRTHRMTELFGRLAPGVSIEDARAELGAAHAALVREHAASYPPKGDVQVAVASLRDQITAPARPVLLILMAAAGIVFVIACANVANLILARSVRREGELAVRAALGAGHGALRRTLFAEALVLCGAGAAVGVLIAAPLVTVIAGFASRYSVRALNVSVDSGALWIGVGLALAAAVLLAYVPRLPSPHAPTGLGLAAGSARVTPGTHLRLRAFATAQIACSFVLLAGAGTLLVALVALQGARTGFNMHQVLVFDLPTPGLALTSADELEFYKEVVRRVEALPGVQGAALGNFTPWRDVDSLVAGGTTFTVEGHTPADGEGDPRARLRVVSPGFFAVLGLPVLAGRDFTAEDRGGAERVVIVSESVARQLFPNGEALNRRMWWTDPYFGTPTPRRIVGVVADVEDQNVRPGPALTIYHPLDQMRVAGRLFVQASADPYGLVQPVTRVVRAMSATQAVDRPATLHDIRAEVLTPDRLSAFVIGGFAVIALLIAAVGVAGVLAFSVSARTREFGVRLAIGSTPAHLLLQVLAEGTRIVTIGLVAGGAAAVAFARLAGGFLDVLRVPVAEAWMPAAAVLLAAAVLASLIPAARAAHVDVLQALKSE